MLSSIIKIIIIILVLAVIGFIGLSVWSAACSRPDTGLEMPDIEEATHSFYIENSGGLIFASDYEQHGQVVGKRIFVLKGFWELQGQKFVYKNIDIVLDEAVFGEITVKRRT